MTPHLCFPTEDRRFKKIYIQNITRSLTLSLCFSLISVSLYDLLAKLKINIMFHVFRVSPPGSFWKFFKSQSLTKREAQNFSKSHSPYIGKRYFLHIPFILFHIVHIFLHWYFPDISSYFFIFLTYFFRFLPISSDSFIFLHISFLFPHISYIFLHICHIFLHTICE